MQSVSDAPVEVVKKISVTQRNCQLNGKENCMTSPRLQHQQALQNEALHRTKKSKLPVLSKAREPPDFQKMHQTWQTHFQKGKAVSKKSCTRPQPFNFCQRGERPRRPIVDVKTSSIASSNEQRSCNSPASNRCREPLVEVVLHQNKKESTFVKGASEMEFKADPSALASILSNVGVSAAPVGKVSLAQRVPMKGSSIPLHSNKNAMIRSSMYTVSNSQVVVANLDRMSCFSKMNVKATEQNPLFKPQIKNPILETTAKLPGELKKEELHPQENPVLQQMNPPTHLPTSDKTSCLLAAEDDHLINLTPLPVLTGKTGAELSTRLCKASTTKLDGSLEKDYGKKNDTSSVDFVADSQALANILSNTEINNAFCGKLSLAQRVPMQGRSSMFKGAMPLPGGFMMQTATPKPACAPVSNLTVSLKELTFSPCRVPLVTSDKSSGGSARRVFQTQSSTVKFSQQYSVTSKPPVFPKTPRALALEKANKYLVTDKTDIQALLKSTIKWADELSPCPSSEIIFEREPNMEEVAMRLFLDGEGPEEPEKKKELTIVPHPLMVLESPPTSAPQHKELVQADSHRAIVGDSPNIQFHSQMHFAPLSQPSVGDSSFSVSCLKSSVPLSFLAHPAVQALQSSTLGPCSLPDIARLRLQAAVSAKQRFWEARLDEECAFYTSRGASGSNRSCKDPVSLCLDKQEDLHFTPICSGES